MRILRFIVNRQILSPDEACDFTGLIPGTKGYLIAKFDFSPEWAGCKKAASFWRYGDEYAVPIIGSECVIPEEVLDSRSIQVSVTGGRDGYRIVTNKCRLKQEG